MKIRHLRTNHLVNPLGYNLDHVSLSYLVEECGGTRQERARIQVFRDTEEGERVYDSGWSRDISHLAFSLPLKLSPSTRYYWKVSAEADNGECADSEFAWFETAKDDKWDARWIGATADPAVQVTLFRNFVISKPVRRARIYLVGLGLYELYLNGEKQGDECLLPGFCAYDSWIPYQTFVLDLLPGRHELALMLGDGWYKGWYGLRKTSENYGDRLACIGELHIHYEDGSFEKIVTDTAWRARKSPVCCSGIYPGEVFDPGIDCSEIFETEELDLSLELLQPRRNPGIRVQETIRPQKLIRTPAGEWVLDLGQNMTGWLQFRCRERKGTRLRLQFGEILQDGNFYRDNLRTARAEFTYISDGREGLVRQHFTFYGFRYVKLEGWSEEPDPEDFRGLVIYSDMEDRGEIRTSHPMVNRLFSNIKWGQKGNFLDIPTDCPQRDERYGWTGDAQIFSGTACYNMDCYAFYGKYGYDIACEQAKFCGGVPDVVPLANFTNGTISTFWGEAATIIPWNVYLHSGDSAILNQQYDSMRAWVDYMRAEDERSGGRRLWQTGFHYGDWLALDGRYENGVFGATDPFLIASAFYYYSTRLLTRAARVLGKEEDAGRYGRLADEIRRAFTEEYFSSQGRLCVDTMTAYVVVLYTGLVPDFACQRIREGLKKKLRESRYHLETGFVGTPYLLRVLSDHGMNDLAYQLLTDEEYPGWLYEVKMGATTIWERWDSVLPDGRMSGTEMNSLNHYAAGSVAEWMYRDMLGIFPLEEKPGFQVFCLSPKPNWRIPEVSGRLRTDSGVIRCSYAWKQAEGRIEMDVEVPFDAEAELRLTDVSGPVSICDRRRPDRIQRLEPSDGCAGGRLTAGRYQICYQSAVPFRRILSLDSPMEELKADPGARRILEEEFYSVTPAIPFEKEMYTLRDMLNGPFTHLPYEKQEEIDRRLRELDV